MRRFRLAFAAAGAIIALAATAVAGDLRSGGVPMRLEAKRDARPVIAIVIDDVGLDWARFQSANALPLPVTLAFLPYGSDAQAMLDATDPRHEPILHLPMEPYRRKHDAGPDMVRAGDPAAARAALRTNLAKLSGYRGVNNHTGSQATADGAVMASVLQELRDRDLYFLDSGTTDAAVPQQLGVSVGANVLRADFFLDGDFGKGGRLHVERKLEELERLAAAQGSAIAIGHPYPSTISALSAWAATARDRFRFVTVEDLAALEASERLGTGF